MKDDIKSVVRRFQVRGELVHFTPVTRGHINDTYILTAEKAGRADRYVLQRINNAVFKDPVSMMTNIIRVTDHIRDKVQNFDPGLASRQLTVITTDDGLGCYEDTQGNYWRVYNFIEDAVTHDTLESTELAYESARMFGWFQSMLIDLPGPVLHETIPDFHNTPRRFEVFREVREVDALSRAEDARPEIDFLFENSGLCNVLLNLAGKGEIPGRIAHNDAKINNVMLDEKTNKGVCVIDLDTVMPGLSLYDFGDMIRTATCSAPEDERDLSKVAVDFSMFEALVRGYAAEAGQFLTPAERENLVFAGKLITFEQFMRFLTDYLAGDVYYKISRKGHNLDRSRTQMKLVKSIVEQEEAMTGLVERVFAENSAR
ncbi:MAG: aminoglycoside phosphotransferase family protein [Planctomycetota bacterium]|nr:aminoglycoside phosphotransferase family protein [Planctomycetota bacterium]